MAKDKILSEIKNAEASARKTVDDGIKRKQGRIISARAEAREYVKQAEADAQKSAQNAMRSAEDAISSEKKLLINAGQTEADAIKKKASSNMDKAVSVLLSEFERAVHA